MSAALQLMKAAKTLGAILENEKWRMTEN